jgi:large subunit ribosomal protein L18
VFRSAKHIYAQAIDDTTNTVLAAASDLDEGVKGTLEGKDKKGRAREVGKAVGAKLVAKQVTQVVFDRNGYLYHGRVAEVADGAREAGLQF